MENPLLSIVFGETYVGRAAFGSCPETAGPNGVGTYAWPMVDFEQEALLALDALPPELRRAMSNVTIVFEDEPPDGEPLLGLYQGVPLTRRTSGYAGALPDKITIFRGPLERLYGADPDQLRAQIRHVVLHEVAHHFGISDERLVELGRY
jgi:predicted Zn-dependent protease with MMP-like domain